MVMSINDFKSQLAGGGARPSQFKVVLTFPAWVNGGSLAGQQAQFLTKNASLPGSMVSDIQVRYQGRAIHLAGEREYSPWNISIYNDTTFNIRNAFESWQSGILQYENVNGIMSPADYQVDAMVHQLDRNGNIIKSYKFFDMYPTEISPIELDYENTNQIEVFSCNLVYNYFIPA